MTIYEEELVAAAVAPTTGAALVMSMLRNQI
jgi:hypothetical protein